MLAELAKTSPVPIVLADEGEDAARVRDFLSQQNIPADAVLLDSGSSLSNALGSGVYPTTLFVDANGSITARSEEHTSELQSLMRISYAVFCLKTQKKKTNT